jgi:hypothetical protein
MVHELKKENCYGYDLTLKQYDRMDGKKLYEACVVRNPSKSRWPKVERIAARFELQETEAAVTRWKERQESWLQRKADEKKAKQQARANMVNPFKVGDILHRSWGYEQTNNDFYQVVEAGPRSVMIRKIGKETVEATGWASSRVRPVKNAFLVGKEPVRKNLVVSSWSPNPYLSDLSLWDEKDNERGVHESWYA